MSCCKFLKAGYHHLLSKLLDIVCYKSVLIPIIKRLEGVGITLIVYFFFHPL